MSRGIDLLQPVEGDTLPLLDRQRMIGRLKLDMRALAAGRAAHMAAVLLGHATTFAYLALSFVCLFLVRRSRA
jgi:hypothetical protein